jgi:hypothetical protein
MRAFFIGAAMTGTIATIPKYQFLDSLGVPLVNGTLETYLTGSTTPTSTWQDAALTSLNTNPIVLDSRGEATLWLDSSIVYKFVLKNEAGATQWTENNIAGNDSESIAFAIALAASSGSSLVGHISSAIGATATTLQEKERLEVNLWDFMSAAQKASILAGTALVPMQDALQLAINHCATFTRWPELVIPGRCLITASVNIDRLVDTTLSDFVIRGDGAGAGFYTTGAVTIFDSTISVTVDPKVEFVKFKDLHFETSSIFNESFVLSKKYLRVRFDDCRFALMRCILSDTYVQTMHFVGCNIRNTPASFINSVGLYDVRFNSCVVENGSTLVRSVDGSRGCSGLVIDGNVIEGIQSSIVLTQGVAGFVFSNNHCESNFAPEINTFAGGVQNKSMTITGNYIYNPVGATVYHGPTDYVFSAGNTVSPSILHSNADQVVNLVSGGDDCLTGGLSDATVKTVMNGVSTSGTATRTWTDTSNHLTKDSSGQFGFGSVPVASVRAYLKGKDQTATAYSAVFADSAGNNVAMFRNDRAVVFSGIQAFANDAGAAAGGIPLGGLYRIGTALQIRVV